MNLPLDERLSMLSVLTPACTLAADIGADHGFLGASLLQSGHIHTVQFIDISDKSLGKARRLVKALNLTDRARFTVGDGAENVDPCADAAIIAGLGAETIAGIVERGSDRFREMTLILQPNYNADILRRRITAAGFLIVQEDVIRAKGRWYVGIVAKAGERALTEYEIAVGPALLASNHPLLADYARFHVRVLQKALGGALRGDRGQAEPIERALNHWKEVLK